jgi:anti-sigma regulatory factor (Ser/Thr protein kinase)
VTDGVQTKVFGVTVEEVAAMDTWVEQVASQWDVSEKAVFGVRLCIAELAANVLEHGIARIADDQIVITIERRKDAIEVEFLDSRQAFDPLAAAPSEAVAAANGGGKGLLLLKAYASDLSYGTDRSGNRTRFRVKSS